MSLLEWINSNGLVFAIMCLVGTIFLVGIDAVARELQDRHLWKIRRQQVDVQETDPQIDELVEYFNHIKDDFDHLSAEMDGALKEINRRATKPIEYGENVVKLRED